MWPIGILNWARGVKNITSSQCSRAKESCACLIHSCHSLFLSNWMKNRAARQRKPLPPKTDRQVGRRAALLLACLSDVSSDRIGLTTDDRLQKQGGRKWKKERKREKKRPPHNPPPPLELWEAAGLEKAKGRKGSGDSLLFELCVLWLQSQHTHLGLAIYILSISMQAEHRLQPFSSSHTLWRRCI